MKYGNILREILKRKDKFIISVQGNSMYPTFLEGEKVEITNPSELKRGDVVLFENHRLDLIFHRIEYLSEKYIITKGDNHKFRDDMIERNSVIAKACECRGEICELFVSNPIELNFCDETLNLRELNQTIIKNSGIKVSNRNKLQIEDNNILIHPAGNERFSKLIFCENKKNVLHFNKKISNTEKEGYMQLDKFNHVVYITNPITHSIAQDSDLISLVYGALNQIV